MSEITVKQAALLAGKTKETINKATNDGTLSVSRNAQGHKVIAVSELERVFPLVKSMDEISDQSEAVRRGQKQSDRSVRSDSEASQYRIRYLEEVADLLNKERLRERHQMQDEIDHLRSTLEKAQEHHGKALLLITDGTQNRAGRYEQSIRELQGQVNEFEKKVSDARSEIPDVPWWDLVFRSKLRA